MKKELLKPELAGIEYGMNPPVELSEWLKKYLKQGDRRKVADSSNISIHTIKTLIYGYTTINNGNYDALVQLVKIAKENAEKELKASKQGLKYFKRILI